MIPLEESPSTGQLPFSMERVGFLSLQKVFLSPQDRLSGDPLLGRAKIGRAVSLLKDGKKEDGVSALSAVSHDSTLLQIDRFEARYLLGVHALGEKDTDTFEAQRKALGENENAADYLSRLVEFERLHSLYAQALSLPDINLAKGREVSEQTKKA